MGANIFFLFAMAGSWAYYGADAGGTRYSPLKQITTANVTRLKVAWTYRTGALNPKTDLNEKAAFEATPILIDGVLYFSTPFDQVIALNPATGVELWKYDPKIDRGKAYSEVTSRGVAAWGKSRLFVGTLDGRLIAIDAKTGQSLWQADLTRDVELRDRGDYQVTSPPVVYRDLVITGSSIGDNRAVDVERGIVRAFDVATGKLRWTWDPVPWAAHTSPRTGAANAWGVLSLDAERGLVYVPTGSASPDFYGGLRPGDNQHANSVVALHAASGELAWGFQVVHHDVWDYDVAAQPTLFTTAKGEPAVAISTKMGLLFVLNRVTGKPIFPVTERAVPKSNVPGEESSPTQPFPATEPLVPSALTAAEAWGATDSDRNWCREKMQPLRAEGIYTPPSLQGSLAFPGNVGGINWGSAAVDSASSVMVVNTNRVSTLLKLIPRDQYVAETTAARKNRLSGEFGRQTGAPYSIYREFLLSPSRLPCNAPPWGTVTAVDLQTGKKLWETPLGSFVPGASFGALNLGGPMITGGGLVFTAAIAEPALRAFDVKTGKEIWKTELPASAQATPMTYSIGGKQYVVICAGGHGKLGSKLGDAVVAFALDDSQPR